MSRNLSNGFSQVSLRGYGDLTVEIWEKGTERALVQRRVDEVHERNEDGKHRSGFCVACAEEYATACEEVYP